MFWTILIFLFITVLGFIVFIEYKNERKYQRERKEKDKNKENNKKEEITLTEISAVDQSSNIATEISIADKQEDKQEDKLVISETIDLPKANYSKFDHSRLLTMGLSEDEAMEYVEELIPQIEAQIPLIKEANSISDFHAMERLTHSIKGSATTVGTGGISDLLIDYNTYLKIGTELSIIEAYFKHLEYYFEELKKQYT